MRPRSGAIHCQSQYDFVTMAEITHRQTAVFYDEKVNQQVNKQLKAKHIDLHNHPHYTQMSSFMVQQASSFASFDYMVQDQALLQERVQLNRWQSNLVQIEVAIQSQQPHEVVCCLQRRLKQSGWQGEQGRMLDLVVEVNGQIIFKYWVVGLCRKQTSMIPRMFADKCKYLVQLDLTKGSFRQARADFLENHKNSELGGLLKILQQIS